MCFRTKLSKAMDIDPAKIYLRSPSFYKDIKVDILMNKKATALDAENQLVSFEDGDNLKYDKLLIATGNNLFRTTCIIRHYNTEHVIKSNHNICKCVLSII